jgi:hypothetical protein
MSKPEPSKFVRGEGDYRDCRFVDDRLVFDVRGRIVIGPVFSAEGCEVSLAKGVEILATGAEFVRCRIVSGSRKMSTMQRARFERCTFEGTVYQGRFGGKTGEPPVVECDFRRADLHDVEFFDCDVREQLFRPWPTMVFVHPEEHAKAIRRAKWPDTFKARVWVKTMLEYPSDGFAANAELVAKELRIEAQQLREIVEPLGDAVMM